MTERDKQKSIASAVCRDGSIVEMLVNQDDRSTSLAQFQAGVMSMHSRLEIPGVGSGVPYSPENNLLTHGVVLFPSAVSDAGADEDLFESVRAFIHRYADLSEGFEEIASYYVLLSWIYDAFSELPYLRLKGDYGSGKTRCLQTIGSICYKPMFVSGASTVSPMFRIIDAFRGTLILDESDFRFSDERAEIIKILNNGNAAGFPVLRSEATPQKEFNPTAFNVYGPKIIATRGDFDDRALESRCITEAMTGLPPRRDIPISLPKTFHSEATELRNCLLWYRFRNLGKDHSIEPLREAGIEPRVAQVFGPLLSVASEPPARQRLITIARKRSNTLNAERGASIEAELLGIMGDMRREKVPLGVKAITELFVSRHGADYQRAVTPRWIGGQIRRRLSLVPIKQRGTFVVAEDDPRLRALFGRYGIEDIADDVETSGMLDAALPPIGEA